MGKTTMRYRCTFTRIAKQENDKKVPTGKDIWLLTPPTLEWCSLFGNHSAVSACKPVTSHFHHWVCPDRNVDRGPQRYEPERSWQCRSDQAEREATRTAIENKTEKGEIYLHSAVLQSDKNGQAITACKTWSCRECASAHTHTRTHTQSSIFTNRQD